MMAYIVRNQAMLARFNVLLGLAGTELEAVCYPALYVRMFDDFVAVNINRADQYRNIGYTVVAV